MRAIALYLHMHQPFRYSQYSIFDVANNHDYWTDNSFRGKQNNERIFLKVAEKSYRPTLDLIERNIKKHPGFKVSLSTTGTWLEQAEMWAPELITKLQTLVQTGKVELVAETYYHSLAFFYDREEFESQVRLHQEKIQDLFGVSPKVFRNTELAYNDELAKWAEDYGFKGILAEGWDKVLEWRSPNHVYHPHGCENLKLLLKNYRLSDDIAFRFSDRKWNEWPLTVPKYQKWLNMDFLRGNLINLFMDFETFGEHQWEDTGIFDFMNRLIDSWLSVYDNRFVTVSEACDLMEPAGEISMPQTVTWADMERDLSAWMGNALQDEAMQTLYGLKEQIKTIRDPQLIEDFHRLTTSDHAYYMSIKYWNDGDVHAYFSAYDSPYDAFMYYVNILRDLKFRVEAANAEQP